MSNHDSATTSSTGRVDGGPELLGIVGGSSLLKSQYFQKTLTKIVETNFGKIKVHLGDGYVFCQRHEASPDIEYSPPHLINKQGIVAAFMQLGVKKVIAFASVGSLRNDLTPGTIVLADDFFNPFEIVSFYNDKRSHYVPALHLSPLRTKLMSLFTDSKISFKDLGTYCQTSGPRFETKSEIRWLAQNGHIVGMTAGHEATLFGEVGLDYALICMIDNYANGIDPQQSLTVKMFHELVALNQLTVEKIAGLVLSTFAIPTSQQK